MLKKIIISLVIILSILNCEQPTNEIIKEVTTIYNIPIIWKGSLSSAPANPEIGWAYYNIVEKKSHVWDGDSWEILAQDGISIIWKGELPSAPAGPQLNWAYYNIIDGNSYIWNGSNWDVLAKAGRDGTSGILLWLGSLASAPSSPSSGYAYYNSTQGISYIWDGDSWEILAQDGQDGIDGTNGSNGIGIVWKGALSNNPLSPQTNWAYYNTSSNTSYIWDGDSWEILSESGIANITVSISFKGSLSSAPINPQIGWMYYNSVLGKSYIWDGSSWNIVAQDGQNGQDGISPVGFLITWKGGLSTAPGNPQQGWAYYNISLKKSYIWDGSTWQILAQDGVDGAGSGGDNYLGSGKITILQNAQELPYYEIPTINAGETASIQFEIKNTGTSTLYLIGSPLVEKGAVLSAYYVDYTSVDVADTATSIAPEASTYFTVNYAPQKGDPRSTTTFIIRSSDASKTPSYVYLYRSARAPGLGLQISANSKSYTYIPYYYSLYERDPITYSAYSSYKFDTLDFGNVTTGSSKSTSSFTINNNYGGVISTLNLTGTPPIQISGSDADSFTVTQPSVTGLAPSGSTTAQITFTPASSGIKTATVTIPNNSMEEPNLSFTITGTSVNPSPGLYFTISINGVSYIESPYYQQIYPTGNYTISSVDFGDSQINMSKTASISIQNTGANTSGTTLNLTGTPAIQISGANSNCFIVTQPAANSISSGSSTSANIRFLPDSEGVKTATVTVLNNSPEKPGFSFTITGNGLPPKVWPKFFDSDEGDGQDAVTCSLIDSQGNTYFIGYGFELLTDYSGSDWWIKKFDSAGAEITTNWDKKISLSDSYSGSYDRPTNAVIDSSDNIYVTDGYYTLKFFSNGTEDTSGWRKNTGGTLYIDSQNNVFIVTSSTITKYSSAGSTLWTKAYTGKLLFDGSDNVAVYSGSNLKYISSSGVESWGKIPSEDVAVTPINGWYNSSKMGGIDQLWRFNAVSGHTYSISWNDSYQGDGTKTADVYVQANWSSGNSSIFSRTDSAWNTPKIFTASKTDEVILKVESSRDGTFAIKVVDGTTVANLAGTASYGFTINSAVFDYFGNIYIAGYGDSLIGSNSKKDVWIKKFDQSGNEITSGWNKKYDWGHSDDEAAEKIFTNGTYIFVSGSGNDLLNGASDNDFWIKQYTFDGTDVSAFTKVLDTTINFIRFDTTGNLLFTSGSSTTAKLQKYDIAGTLISSFNYNPYFTANGSSYNYCYNPILMFDNYENFYVSGYGSNLVTSESSYDWVIRKFDVSGVEQ
jgi:hypothetical protein